MLEAEQRFTEGLGGSEIVVYGKGPPGDRAADLFKKSPRLSRMGIWLPRRIAFAEGALDYFVDINGISQSLGETIINSDVEEQIKKATSFGSLYGVFEEMGASFSRPVVVRASGEKALLGTGYYKSDFLVPTASRMRRAFQVVTASYLSNEAKTARDNASVNDWGFGVMFEPMIGQVLDQKGEVLAPLLSGYATSSYMKIYPGLDGKSNRGAEHISREDIFRHGGRLGAYLAEQRQLHIDGLKKRSLQGLLTLGTGEPIRNVQVYNPKVFSNGFTKNHHLSLDPGLEERLLNLNLLPVFSAMDQMEAVFDSPQYFEFAITLDAGGSPLIWGLQATDAYLHPATRGK